MQFPVKIMPKNRLAPSGKSWIRHWHQWVFETLILHLKEAEYVGWELRKLKTKYHFTKSIGRNRSCFECGGFGPKSQTSIWLDGCQAETSQDGMGRRSPRQKVNIFLFAIVCTDREKIYKPPDDLRHRDWQLCCQICIFPKLPAKLTSGGSTQ